MPVVLRVDPWKMRTGRKQLFCAYGREDVEGAGEQICDECARY